MKAERVKKMKRFQAHVAEDSDQEVEEKAKKDEDSSEEYVLISSLKGSVSPANDTWLVDSGASKHMTGVVTRIYPMKFLDSGSAYVKKDLDLCWWKVH